MIKMLKRISITVNYTRMNYEHPFHICSTWNNERSRKCCQIHLCASSIWLLYWDEIHELLCLLYALKNHLIRYGICWARNRVKSSANAYDVCVELKCCIGSSEYMYVCSAIKGSVYPFAHEFVRWWWDPDPYPSNFAHGFLSNRMNVFIDLESTNK